jgi:hypothetical protein
MVPFVNCYTSRGGTSAKIQKARRWELLRYAACPFCGARVTVEDSLSHVLAAHADPGNFDDWRQSFAFGGRSAVRDFGRARP